MQFYTSKKYCIKISKLQLSIQGYYELFININLSVEIVFLKQS